MHEFTRRDGQVSRHNTRKFRIYYRGSQGDMTEGEHDFADSSGGCGDYCCGLGGWGVEMVRREVERNLERPAWEGAQLNKSNANHKADI